MLEFTNVNISILSHCWYGQSLKATDIADSATASTWYLMNSHGMSRPFNDPISGILNGLLLLPLLLQICLLDHGLPC